MQLTNIRHAVELDLQAVDKLIVQSLHSDVPLVKEVAQHLIKSGGKRLRPLSVLLTAKANNYVGDAQITMATIIEFIHTATLLHDDVVDNSLLRRGSSTANNTWGNQAAVLVGDFLYSRAFQLMVQLNDSQIMRIIANATNTIAEGEVMQLMNQHNSSATESEYLQIIRHKTAKLFEAATESAAVLCKLPRHIQNAFAEYGLHLGTAYQLIDDLLDYQADQETLGKSIGNDLAEGKPTLPLIYLLQHGSTAEQQLLRQAIDNPKEVDASAIQQLILNSSALEYTRDFAIREADLAMQALSELPADISTDELIDLAHYIIDRDH